MSDLISRQAAIEAVHKSIYDFFDICDDDEESPMTYKDELLLELNKAITTQIKAVAEAEPTKHGHWIDEGLVDGNQNRYCRCSECGKGDTQAISQRVPYCWWCGARMDGGENG